MRTGWFAYPYLKFFNTHTCGVFFFMDHPIFTLNFYLPIYFVEMLATMSIVFLYPISNNAAIWKSLDQFAPFDWQPLSDLYYVNSFLRHAEAFAFQDSAGKTEFVGKQIFLSLGPSNNFAYRLVCRCCQFILIFFLVDRKRPWIFEFIMANRCWITCIFVFYWLLTPANHNTFICDLSSFAIERELIEKCQLDRTNKIFLQMSNWVVKIVF